MSAPGKISSIPFVDLYLCLEGGQPAHYRGSMRGLTKHPNIGLGPEYEQDLEHLKAHIGSKVVDDRTIIVYDGVRLRVAFIHSSNGQKWVALRRVKDKPPKLDSLGFPAALVPHLQAMGARDGLILICGATGQGKTTTSCSLLLDYLEQHGGVGFTIEDPVEYDLAGRHGESGFCYQVEVRRDGEWADALLNSLRCHPRYIFIGEVCTPDIANQLLRAATSGHLVIATLHAGTVFEGIEGLLQLAEQVIGERAKQLLAASFTAIIHQNLTQYGLSTRFLVTDNNGSQSMSIRSLIRDNKIGQIASVMDQQHALLMQSGQLFR
jgi:twitching motility protein PilT